jgi:hypothetical protein
MPVKEVRVVHMDKLNITSELALQRQFDSKQKWDCVFE